MSEAARREKRWVCWHVELMLQDALSQDFEWLSEDVDGNVVDDATRKRRLQAVRDLISEMHRRGAE
jgi:hypothetical protein